MKKGPWATKESVKKGKTQSHGEGEGEHLEGRRSDQTPKTMEKENAPEKSIKLEKQGPPKKLGWGAASGRRNR